MTSSDSILTLISRLEQATEGSHELDEAIWAALLELPGGRSTKMLGKNRMHGDLGFTRSMDCAMTLLPEGNYDQTWSKTTRGKGTWEHWTLYQVRICLETVEEDPDETSPEAIGCHNSLPIAACIASLKAISHTP